MKKKLSTPKKAIPIGAKICGAQELSSKFARNVMLFLTLSCCTFQVALSQGDWVRNSFPSAKHKAESFIPYGGEMRGQRVNFFGISPANPNFMIMSGNMWIQGFVSNNGKDFKPFSTEAGWSGNTFGFSPHNGSLAFGLMGARDWTGSDDANWGTDHPYGIYRTLDTGETWTQVLRLPENLTGDPTSINTTPGQEPVGKRVFLVDPAPARSTHVYYGSSENGLLRSTSNGDAGTWEVVAFAGKFIKTMSAGVSLGGETRLYLVVADGYSTPEDIHGQVYHDSGRLYRIDINNATGVMSTPELCLNGLYNITDVETNEVGKAGFVIIDASAAGGESTGGRALYPFRLQGEPVSGDSGDLGMNVDGATLTTSAGYEVKLDADDYPNMDTLGAIYQNPYNPNHWVIQVGGNLEHSFIWSDDDGLSWSDITRGTTTDAGTGQEYVSDFVSGAVGQFHMQDFGWSMDQESGRGDQGSAVGFMDATTVVWMSSSKDRPVLKSTNFGATATSFTTGSETKWLNQISTAANGTLIGGSLGEYGFALSTDGGESWQGITEFSDDIMHDIESISQSDFGSGGASNRAGFGIIWEEGIPLNQPQHAILLASRAGIIVDAWQTADLSSWVLTMRGDPTDPQRVYINKKSDADFVGEGFWVDNYVYLGNFRSSDNGVTFDQLALPDGKRLVVLEVSSSNGQVAIATRERVETSQFIWSLYLTTDGGNTWTSLEKPDRETATAPGGGTTNLFPISFNTYNKNRHAIAIDPRAAHDPTLGGTLRFLMGGRKGVYEFDDTRAPGNKWNINSVGLDGSLHYNLTETTPWMGPVQFDPRQNGVVYSVQTSDRLSMSDWKDPAINNNCLYEGEGTYKPIYLSTDWGVTWTNLDDNSLPDMLTIPTIHVNEDGILYAASANAGIFQYSGIDAVLNVNNETIESMAKVYPNPAKDELNIEVPMQIQTDTPVIIYDSIGREFKRFMLDGRKKTIDVSSWKTGLYYLKVIGTDSAEKIIIE
ncbi:hypothetical protein KH5_12070 [Urechidicola sp. KH5]